MIFPKLHRMSYRIVCFVFKFHRVFARDSAWSHFWLVPSVCLEIVGHRRRGAVRSTVAGSAQSAPGRKEGRPAGRDDSRMEGLSDRWTDRLSRIGNWNIQCEVSVAYCTY